MTRVLKTDVTGVLGGDSSAPNGPAEIRPGQVLPFGGEYVLPAGRRAVGLTGPVITDGDTVVVHL